MIKLVKMSDELKELQKIARLLTLAHAEIIEKELSKYATTDERKMIWVLIDGVRMSKDMVPLIASIKIRAINIFLNQLEKAQLIENPWGKPPRKLIDYVPPSWIELIKEEEGKSEQSKGEESKL